MTNRNTGFAKCALAVIVPLGLAALLLGCGKKQPEAAAPVDFAGATNIFSSPYAPRIQPKNPTSVVCTVEGTPITQRELDTEIAKVVSQLRRQFPPERIAQMRDDIIKQSTDSLIIKTLLHKTVEEEKIAVDAAEIDRVIQNFEASLPLSTSLEQHLTRINVSEEELRDAIGADLKISKLLKAQVADLVEPTDEEIAAYYGEHKPQFIVPETIKARHILVAVHPDDDEETRAAKLKKAQDVRQQLLDGADFAELAAEHSDDPTSRPRGGELPPLPRQPNPTPFQEAVWNQEVDTIGEIRETPAGYHIVEVTGREEGRTRTLDEVRDRITEFLTRQRQEQKVQSYLADLRSSATVTYPETP